MNPTSSPAPSAPAGTTEVRKPASPLFFVLYTLACFGVWMAVNLPASVTIALRISVLDPANMTTTYSIVAGVGAAVAIFANPFFGRMSDRTRSKWGRRRPWIVVGLAGTTVGAAIISFSDSLPLLFAGWVVMQCFVNAMQAGLLSIIADQFPERQHGVLGSINGATATLSIMVGTFIIQLFPTQILAQMGLPMVFAIIVITALLPLMKEGDSRGMPRTPFGVKELFGSFVINPRKSPNFALYLGALFLVETGTVGLATYHVYYMQNVIGIPAADLPDVLVVWGLVNGAASLITAPLAGFIVDRTKRVKTVFASAAVFGAASAVVIVASHTMGLFYVGTVLEGISFGIVTGVYFVFATSTMNNPDTIARDLGVLNFAATSPYSIVPLLAPLALAVGGGGDNYALLFLLGGAADVLALAFLPKIRTAMDKKAPERGLAPAGQAGVGS